MGEEEKSEFIRLCKQWDEKFTEPERFSRFLLFFSNLGQRLEKFRLDDVSSYLILSFSEVGIDIGFHFGGYSWALVFEKLDYSFRKNIKRYFISLQIVVNELFSHDENIKKVIIPLIERAIQSSGVLVDMGERENGISFFPKGAPVLDQMVVDNLGQLKKYEKSFSQFEASLQMYLQGEYDVAMVNSLRLSLELLIKEKLGVCASLEKAHVKVGEFLEKNGINKEIRSGYFAILSLFEKYQNDSAKHQASVQKNEVEYILYQTAVFMRLLLVVDIQK